MSDFITPSKFADHVGVSKMAISKAIQSGKISQAVKPRGNRKMLHKRIAEFEYLGKGEAPTEEEIEQIAAAWSEEDDVKKQTGLTDRKKRNSNNLLWQSRAIKEQFIARMKKMEYEKMAGELIPADVVKVERYNQGRKIRDVLLNIPNKVAASLAVSLGIEIDPNKLTVLMEDEISSLLKEIAQSHAESIDRISTPESY